ncbi:MAG: hypothetical protein KGH79_02815 [Patescibacteria group bacterium]|nr:hypothetical protein [Patescibacteria group bacterium]
MPTETDKFIDEELRVERESDFGPEAFLGRENREESGIEGGPLSNPEEEVREPMEPGKQAVLDQKGGEPNDWTLEYKGDSGYRFDGQNVRDPEGNIWVNEDEALHQEMLAQWTESGSSVFFLPDYHEVSEEGKTLYVTTMILGEKGEVTYEIHKYEAQYPRPEDVQTESPIDHTSIEPVSADLQTSAIDVPPTSHAQQSEVHVSVADSKSSPAVEQVSNVSQELVPEQSVEDSSVLRDEQPSAMSEPTPEIESVDVEQADATTAVAADTEIPQRIRAVEEVAVHTPEEQEESVAGHPTEITGSDSSVVSEPVHAREESIQRVEAQHDHTAPSAAEGSTAREDMVIKKYSVELVERDTSISEQTRPSIDSVALRSAEEALPSTAVIDKHHAQMGVDRDATEPIKSNHAHKWNRGADKTEKTSDPLADSQDEQTIEPQKAETILRALGIPFTVSNTESAGLQHRHSDAPVLPPQDTRTTTHPGRNSTRVTTRYGVTMEIVA